MPWNELNVATSSAVSGDSAFVRIVRTNCERDPASSGELSSHNRLTRRTRLYEIVQDPVGDRFIKCALVSVRCQVELERFAFDAKAVRHIIDIDPSKIRLTGDRANGSEIVRFEMNPVVPTRCGIWERLEPRLSR